MGIGRWIRGGIKPLTLVESDFSLCRTRTSMADNIPNTPAGAVPPKKETGKVQPKKETVRITLPPKPSAAPTIKLPTLPPGGPGAAGSKPGAAPATAPRPASAPGSASAPRAAAAPTSATGAPRAAGAGRAPARSAPSAGAQFGQMESMLSIAAAVVGLIAVGSSVYLAFIM